MCVDGMIAACECMYKAMHKLYMSEERRLNRENVHSGIQLGIISHGTPIWVSIKCSICGKMHSRLTRALYCRSYSKWVGPCCK